MPIEDAPEVDSAPPGLEGFVGSTIGSDNVHAASLGEAAAGDPSSVAKQELVNEVTRLVTEQLESKTSAAVDALWRKGQRALCSMQQQQLDQIASLQRQLQECTASHHRLEQESGMLRNQFEALMGSMKLILGLPLGQPAAFPLGMRRAPHTPQSDMAEAMRSSMEEESSLPREISGDTGSDEGPRAAPPRPAEEARSATASTSDPSPDVEARTFSLTLRRAHGVPLGLDVGGQRGSSTLTVKAIRPGGAVEAWNKQSPGDLREVRVGDRIIMVNDAEEASEMREQCRHKLLLRIKVLRSGADSTTESKAQDGAGGGSCVLRADANEFVPNAGLGAWV